ncbi:MAG: hypothetical protein HGB19_08960 [Chlorobiales bacterium]|jgi:hypothetical protein|nr:hypothetical protein [Chlorobiales bacterium]
MALKIAFIAIGNILLFGYLEVSKLADFAEAIPNTTSTSTLLLALIGVYVYVCSKLN